MELEVRGARDNNLADVDLTLPLGALVVFCGRSGSGKSSLAFDTLHREGQRRYLEALLLQNGTLRRPDVESIEGLPPTIGLDQRERGFPGPLTVAAACDLEAPLAVLFGRTGAFHCPVCGRPIEPRSHDAIVEHLLELPAGTRLTLEAPVEVAQGVLDEITRAGFSRVRVDDQIVRLDSIGRLPTSGSIRIVVDRVKVDVQKRSRILDAVRLASRAGRGVVVAVHDATEVFVDRPLCVHDGIELPPNEPSRFRTDAQAEDLGLDEAARAVTVEGHAFVPLLRRTVSTLRETLASWPVDPVREAVLADLDHRLEVLERLGLGALVLAAPAAQASRGEGVRLRLARQVSSRVSGVLYVLDEPASGLDDASARAVTSVLRTLVEQGNSVVAVDHHPVLVRAADHVVEMGPGAGPRGGRVVYEGSAVGLEAADTSTGRVLREEVRAPQAPASGRVERLAGWTVDRPGVTVLSGPSGSGKSRALDTIAEAGSATFDRVVYAGATSVARSKRSSTATYTGIWTTLRDLLSQTREARVQGLSSSAFSLNTKGGRCETCKGEGALRTVMEPLPDVWTPCPVCRGRRFQSDVLGVRWKGHAPDELLRLVVADALPLLAGHPGLERPLRALVEVGLGHVQLGRSTDTLSGGEVRRLKLARELARARGPGLVLADDPSLGLHPEDTVELLTAFHRLAESGSIVVLASSDPWVVAGATRVVELP